MLKNRRQNKTVVSRLKPPALAAWITFAALPAWAQTYTVLYTAPGSPGITFPIAQANAQGRDGNIYSTSYFAGNVAGGMFSISPTGSFTLVNDMIGGFVVSGVTLGRDGDFYGTDQDLGLPNCDGQSGCGQVYKITPSGAETVLYQFTNGTDGSDPQAPPILATNGKYYGTTLASTGGANSVAYAVSSKGAFTNLHVFTSAEGQPVQAALVQGSDGNLYGMTAGGGSHNDGTIFKMSLSGSVKVIYDFQQPTYNGVSSPLIQASDGNFYGTTSGGGKNNTGTVFRVSPKGKYHLLHDFVASTDGNDPTSSLTQASDGNFYGVTAFGGSAGGGTIYSLTPKGAFKVLYNYDNTNFAAGYQPQSPLTQSTTGKFIGMTYYGGACASHASTGCGVIYSLDTGLAPFAALEEKASIEGGTIGIFGQGFDKSTTVTFGGVPAAILDVTASTYLIATVPVGALSGVVTVTTGSTSLTSGTLFSVTPTLPSFSPTSGASGTSVVLNGTGLMQTSSVTFAGTPASFHVKSDSKVTAIVPTGAKTGKISVKTQGGSATSQMSFTVD